MVQTLEVLLSLTGDSEQVKSIFHSTGIVKQVLRIATNFEDDKPSPSNPANLEAYKVLINLSEHDPITQELVSLNAPARLSEHVVKLYKRYPVHGKSKIDDGVMESAIVVLANLTRFYIGMEALLQLDKPVELQGIYFLRLVEIYLQNPADPRLDYLSAVIANCCPKPEGRKVLLSDKGAAMQSLIKNLFGNSPVRMVYTLIMLENCLVDKKASAEWVIKTKAYVDCLYAYILLCNGVRDVAFISYWLQKIVQIPIKPEVEDRYKKLSEEHKRNIMRHSLEALVAMATCEEVKKEMENDKVSSVVGVLIEKTDSKELTDTLLLLNSKLA